MLNSSEPISTQKPVIADHQFNVNVTPAQYVDQQTALRVSVLLNVSKAVIEMVNAPREVQEPILRHLKQAQKSLKRALQLLEIPQQIQITKSTNETIKEPTND